MKKKNLLVGMKTALDKGHTVFIEREVGAEDMLHHAGNLLKEHSIYFSTAATEGDNIFSRAMPDQSDLLRIRAPPRVLMVSLSDASGVTLTEVHRDKASMDPDIFSGMLSAVSNFVKDSVKMLNGEMDGPGGLDALSYSDEKLGNLTIRIRRGTASVLVVSYKGDPSVEIENDITQTNQWIEEHYGDQIKNWSNNMNELFIKDISERITDTFIHSGRYDGKYDMDSMMECKEDIKKTLLESINKPSQKKIAFLFDDMECIDPLSLELLDHVVHNSNVKIVCQYNTDVLEGGVNNEGLSKLIRGYHDQNRCTVIPVRADVDIEEVIRSKLAGVDRDSLWVMKYAAVADTFDRDVITGAMKDSGMDAGSMIDKLRGAGIVKGNGFANSRLRERTLEELRGKEKRKIELHVVSSLIKSGDPQHSVRIAELLLPYAKHHDVIRRKAVGFSIDAGDLLLRNFDTERALYFYNKAIEFEDDDNRKQKILEKTLILESLTWI